jgi:hypothetical protein
MSFAIVVAWSFLIPHHGLDRELQRSFFNFIDLTFGRPGRRFGRQLFAIDL